MKSGITMSTSVSIRAKSIIFKEYIKSTLKEMKNRTAIVFGATGLVGKALVEELCNSDQYFMIKVFARHNTGFAGAEKIREFVIDFNNLKEYSELITGDDLYICLGTTIKKAGSVKRMEEIDRDLPVNIATIAFENSVGKLAVISSLGANAGSSNYYLRIKGEMERGLMKLKFRTLIILRPSMLLGERNERRTGEAIGKIVMKILGVFFFGRLLKYKGIAAKNVARTMIKAINGKSGTEILESDEIQKISAIN
jgi:uncharacterized protein YbjT (DUF2867 family)